MNASLHPFSKAMAAFAAARTLLPADARVLVALSGGPDSCALLLALCQSAEAGLLPRPIGVAHFHHGLRGADADADAAFSAALAAHLGLPCVVGLGAVRPIGGESPNAAARRERYTFLTESARALGANTIVTAHTRDDQAETVLGRIFRGTGVAGLAGIPVRRALNPGLAVVRPLLGQSRANVEAFCADCGITPRRDPSNEKERYQRARLRRHFPDLARDFNPRLNEALVRLAAQAARDDDLLRTFAEELYTRAAIHAEAAPPHAAVRAKPQPSVVLSVDVLRNAHPALRSRALLKALRQIGKSPGDTNRAAADREAGVDAEAATAGFVARLEAMLHATGKAARLDLPGGIRARCDGATLVLSRPATSPASTTPEPAESYAASVPLRVPGTTCCAPWGLYLRTWYPGRDDALIRARLSPIVDIAYNDAGPGLDAIANPMVPFPLSVRLAQPGDRIAPLGMGGKSRRIRDIMTEAGWSPERRARAPIVIRADTGEALWVVGLVQSESTRVVGGAEAGTVLRLQAEWDAVE